MTTSPSNDVREPDLSLGLDLPSAFHVSVIMEARPANSPWLDRSWQAIGVTVGDTPRRAEPEIIHERDGITHYRYGGFTVELHRDECERYYHNLMSPHPRCFVIATKSDDQPPRPYKVTLDFDDAHAYEEGDEWVYTVDIPPDLYRWCEAFVLENYAQEKKYKRKLNDWSASDSDPQPE